MKNHERLMLWFAFSFTFLIAVYEVLTWAAAMFGRLR